MKRNTVFFALMLFISLLLSGCTPSSPETQRPSSDTSLPREAYRAELSVFTDTPFTEDSPTLPLGYAGVQTPNLLWTAKHLLQGDISRLLIKNADGIPCPIQHIWLHPTKDIALIKTSKECVLGIQAVHISINTIPNELLYLENTLKRVSVISSGYGPPLLAKQLTPGMSGSPLFLSNRTIVGIVSAQNASGTEFIPITTELIRSWPEAKKELLR